MTISEPLAAGSHGLSTGPVSSPDIPDVAALMQRVAMHAIGKTDVTVDEVRDEFQRPGFDLEQDVAIARDRESKLVVYVEAFDEHANRAYIDVFVDPALAGQVFDEAARLALLGAKARIAEALAERGATETTVGAGLYHGEDRMLRAYERAGFERENIYWRMSIQLSDWEPADSAIQPPLTVRSVDPHDDHVLAQALTIRNEEFREHHGHVDITLDEFAARVRSASSYDRNGWWFAYRNEEIVGICLADNSKVDENAGHIRTLAVVRPARGQGVAKSLLRTAFAEYKSRGLSSVQLSVDTSNSTGATQLYESVGMKPILAIDSLTLTVTAKD